MCNGIVFVEHGILASCCMDCLSDMMESQHYFRRIITLGIDLRRRMTRFWRTFSEVFLAQQEHQSAKVFVIFVWVTGFIRRYVPWIGYPVKRIYVLEPSQ